MSKAKSWLSAAFDTFCQSKNITPQSVPQPSIKIPKDVYDMVLEEGGFEKIGKSTYFQTDESGVYVKLQKGEWQKPKIEINI